MSSPWITEVHLRQSSDLTWEEAYERVLDAAQALMAAGWDVTLRPTLPDTVGTSKFESDGSASNE